MPIESERPALSVDAVAAVPRDDPYCPAAFD
jgi:hypothetical protein